jgi:hypothetical protein
MKFIVKFEKNLREELNYSCVDRKTEFILFYFYTKRYIRKCYLFKLELLTIRKASNRIIIQLISPLIGLFVTIDSVKGNTITVVFIVNVIYLIAKSMTQ